MISYLIICLSLIGVSCLAASCGTDGSFPASIEILPSGLPMLQCQVPSCFAHGAPKTACSVFSANACPEASEWLGGITVTQIDSKMDLQCCTIIGQQYILEILGNVTLVTGEVFIGGQSKFGFDMIGDLLKNRDEQGKVYYEVTVSRMLCTPPPRELTNEVMFDPSEIVKIGDKTTKTARPKAYQAAIDSSPGSSDNVAYQEPERAAYQTAEPIYGTAYVTEAPEDPFCFPANALVQTPIGAKRMDQLEVGDSIATVYGNEILFVPVTLFIHKVPDVVVDYLHIFTDNGKSLKVSDRHLVFVCDDNQSNCNGQNITSGPQDYTFTTVFAEDVKIGDLMLTANFDSAAVRPARVMRIKRVTEMGAYAPVVSDGKLLVSGVFASCFADVPPIFVNNAIGRSTMRFIYVVNHWLKHLGMDLFTANEMYVNIPYGWTMLEQWMTNFS